MNPFPTHYTKMFIFIYILSSTCPRCHFYNEVHQHILIKTNLPLPTHFPTDTRCFHVEPVSAVHQTWDGCWIDFIEMRERLLADQWRVSSALVSMSHDCFGLKHHISILGHDAVKTLVLNIMLMIAFSVFDRQMSAAKFFWTAFKSNEMHSVRTDSLTFTSRRGNQTKTNIKTHLEGRRNSLKYNRSG